MSDSKPQLAKLDWIPLYFQRIKGSSAYLPPDKGGLTDFQWGWYFRLLIECADSEFPGYLPGSLDELWRIAGAKSASYFQKWGGPELVSRYFRRTEIRGQIWIYNEKLLRVIQEQNEKLSSGKKRSVSLSLSSELDGLFLAFWGDVWKKVQVQRAKKAWLRAVRNIAAEQGMDEISAAEYIHAAAAEFKESPAGKHGGLFAEYKPPYPESWLNAGRYDDDRTEWYVESKYKLALASIGEGNGRTDAQIPSPGAGDGESVFERFRRPRPRVLTGKGDTGDGFGENKGQEVPSPLRDKDADNGSH